MVLPSLSFWLAAPWHPKQEPNIIDRPTKHKINPTPRKNSGSSSPKFPAKRYRENAKKARPIVAKMTLTFISKNLKILLSRAMTKVVKQEVNRQA